MKILIASAWPYVNYIPHLGTLIGSILSADVFARYARLKYGKDNVAFVSGSDEHGTPIEIEAIRRKTTPKSLTDQAHEYDKHLFLDVWEISFSNYTRTESDVHKAFVMDFFRKLEKYMIIKEEEIPYCEYDKIFLPDRFVRGTCPYCGYEDATGDQCENCGRLLTPSMLINPRCAICGRKPIFKKTKHWFFDLTSFSDKIREWLNSSQTMPDNVKSVSLSWINEGLKPRSLTRDNSWGIPAPFEGAEGKTIYVWFEALLGYVSATIEYFKNIGQPEKWKEFWFGNDVKSYYFIGKDNIPFHAIILPAMLMATGENYVLPTVISATEYLLFEKLKFSKSKKIGVWIDEAPYLADIEYWRFALIRMRPEEKDTSFTWKEFIRIVNTEINDDIGNYTNRVLTMVNRYFNGKIPENKPELYTEDDKHLLSLIQESPRKAGELFEKGKLKAATEPLLELARYGNSYLNTRAPWDLVKKDKDEAANVLYLGANSIRTIAIMIYPLMPRHAQLIYDLLNLGNLEDESWDSASELKLVPGHDIKKDIRPIFKKLVDNFEREVENRLEKIREELAKVRPQLLK